jgi:hypothetical protein
MLRAFSERDLLGKELNKSNVWKRIFTSRSVTLTLHLPNDIFLRANVICDDICEITEERFKLNNLVELLWKDFLDEVRRKQDVKALYKLLLDYDRGTPNVRLSKYNEESIDEVPLYPVRKKLVDHTEYVFCRLDRKDVLRGEVMLSDISKLYPQHPFHFERVLEILFIDFVSKYERGEAVNIIV